MKPKIKIRIVKFEKAIACQILEMDERFRCIDVENEIHYLFDSSTGVSISSYQTPFFRDRGELVLRGYDGSEDLSLCELEGFNSNKERDEYVEKLLAALKEWSTNWKGWKEESKHTESEGEDIYTF